MNVFLSIVFWLFCFEYFIFSVFILNIQKPPCTSWLCRRSLWAPLTFCSHVIILCDFSEFSKVHETSQQTTPLPVWAVTALDECLFEDCILNILFWVFYFQHFIFMLSIQGSSCTSWLWYASALQAVFPDSDFLSTHSLSGFLWLSAHTSSSCVTLVSPARFTRHRNRQRHCLSQQTHPW